MRYIKSLIMPGVFAVASLLFSINPVIAQDKAATPKSKNPYLKPDESWISISGTAVSTKPSSFILDYGKGVITVEMDDWNWYKEGRLILEGDKVTVYGKIDDDLLETAKIEASSVYVEDLGTYFYASSADEEYNDNYDYWGTYGPISPGKAVVRGTVTGVDGREFTIDTGLKKITVDTDNMIYNPVDKTGYQQIDKGDYVAVIGHMDYDFWEKRELKADSVTTLLDD